MRTLILAVTTLAIAVPASAQPLDPATRRIAQAWQRGDVNSIGSFAARSGLSLDVGGQKIGPLHARQAAMALKRVFERVETVSASIGQAHEVEGDPRRAFVEITWVTKAPGTSIPESSQVFFGLVLDGDTWRITEIRLIQ
ncbi:MAG: hypothetical protein ACREL7_11005 [Longimicrobiales bacterium]